MTAEQDRLEQLMKRLDRATAEAFLAYVATMKSPAMIREIERLIASGNIEEAIRITESHIRKFATVIPQNYTAVGASTASAIEPTFRRIAPRIAISFNPAHPRAAAQMERQTLSLISRITDDQRTSVRNALTEALQDGAGPRKAATAYRDAIGLTDNQRRAVNRYRTLLEAGSIEALDRGLADRRYAPRSDSLSARQEYMDNLSQADIDRMVSAYERKYIKYRSEVIARTETTQTLNAANEEAFAQAMEEAGIGDEYIERTWQFSHDNRTRGSHSNMQVRVVRGLNTPFVTGLGNRAIAPGDPNLPAEDVINCRCTVTHRILTVNG